MRNIEEVTKELKEGATLVISSHKEGKIDYCNGYVLKDGKKEEIEILRVFIRYMNIINEVRDDKFFKLTQNKETGLYLSGIYQKDGLIEEKSFEKDYLFDSIEGLNTKLKKVKKIGGIYGK